MDDKLNRAAQRFRKKYEIRGECWIWTAAQDQRGYGRFRDEELALTGAHQFSFKIKNGRPAEGWVLHKCDTPACVNPDHLFEGTPLDNVKDMDAKGRRRHGDRKGEKHGHSKLTNEDISEIKKLRQEGLLLREIADQFSVTIQSIWAVLNGKTWTHIK